MSNAQNLVLLSGLSDAPRPLTELLPGATRVEIKEVADYCETDVINTYRVWLRYELFRGTLSQDAFEASERNLADFMIRKASTTERTVDQSLR